MDIPVSPDNKHFIEASIENGHYADPRALFDEAIRLLKRRDEAIRAVDAGIDELDRGETVDGDQVLDRLANTYRPDPK